MSLPKALIIKILEHNALHKIPMISKNLEAAALKYSDLYKSFKNHEYDESLAAYFERNDLSFPKLCIQHKKFDSLILFLKTSDKSWLQHVINFIFKKEAFEIGLILKENNIIDQRSYKHIMSYFSLRLFTPLYEKNQLTVTEVEEYTLSLYHSHNAISFLCTQHNISKEKFTAFVKKCFENRNPYNANYLISLLFRKT